VATVTNSAARYVALQGGSPGTPVGVPLAIVPGIEKWLPTAAAIGLTNAPGQDPGRVLAPTTAGLVLAGYALALLAAASRTTMRRDLA
jgi:hypothetical protein